MQTISNTKTQIIPYRFNRYWGFVDSNLNTVIKPEYDFVFPFQNGIAQVFKNGNRFLINSRGVKILSHSYDYNFDEFRDCYFGDCNNGLVRIWEDDKYGFADSNGQIVIPVVFDWAKDFRYGTCLVEIDGNYGLIDRNGKFILQPKFKYLSEFYGDLGVFADEQESYIINKANGQIIPIKLQNTYDDVNTIKFSSVFNNEKAVLRIENYNYLHDLYKFLLPDGTLKDCDYKYISECSEGYYVVGKIVKSTTYTKEFNEGFSVYNTENTNLWGLMNQKMEVEYWAEELCINDINFAGDNDPVFGARSNIGTFCEGLAKFKKNGKWGFLNKRFKVQLDSKYQSVSDFKNGFSCVDNKGYIDKLGNEFWIDE